MENSESKLVKANEFDYVDDYDLYRKLLYTDLEYFKKHICKKIKRADTFTALIFEKIILQIDWDKELDLLTEVANKELKGEIVSEDN